MQTVRDPASTVPVTVPFFAAKAPGRLLVEPLPKTLGHEARRKLGEQPLTR